MRVALPLSRTLVLLCSLLTAFASASGQAPGAGTTTPQQPPPTPQIVGSHEIVIDRNTGTGFTTIHRQSAKPLKGSLTGSVNTAAGPKPQIVFKADPKATDSKDVYPLNLTPTQITTVVAIVTDENQVGEFDADLAFEGTNFD